MSGYTGQLFDLSNFASARQRTEFWLFCIATFLAFLTTSALSFLSVILAEAGMPDRSIGLVLSSPALPVTGAILFAGLLFKRLSALQIAIVGQIISLVAFISFQFTVYDVWPAAASRAILGIGFGLFFPAAIVFVRNLLRGPNATYLFGIYSTMIPLPNVAGPSLAEAYFRQIGVHQLFFWLAIPLVIGICLMFLIKSDRVEHQAGSSSSYLSLILNREIFAPNASVFALGLIWGFVLAFMALLLHRNSVATVFFFSTATLTLVVSRFTLLAALASFSRPRIVAFGMFSMATSYAVLSLNGSSWQFVTLSGILFGVGYSAAFPTLSVWVTEEFSPNARGKPAALFSALFHLGIFILPVVGGWISQQTSLSSLLGVMTALAIGVGSALLFASANQKDASKLAISDDRSKSG
jgi:MFS family permease